MQDFKLIKFGLKDGVADVTLNAPPLNVLNIGMMCEICDALNYLRGVEDLKVVVFRGAGDKAFCAGVDVKDHMGQQAEPMIDAFRNMFQAMVDVGAPTLAVVKGFALGGGCELAIFCDLVIAAKSARLGQPEIKVGVFPPLSMVVLPQLVGLKKALELLFSGELVSASEAERIGLINKAVDDEKLDEEAEKLVQSLKDKSSVVLYWTKRTAYECVGLPFYRALRRAEEIYLEELMKTEDAPEGLLSFVEKRKPIWKNR